MHINQWTSLLSQENQRFQSWERRSRISKKKKVALPKIGRKTVKSNFEYEVWKALKHELPRGADLAYEEEELEYSITSNYLPDFIITKRSGEKIYIEAKGNGRSFDNKVRQKLIAVRDQHPGIDLRIVFFSDGKIGSIRKDSTYRRQSDWAVQHKFQFAIRNIPKGWFNE